MLNVGFYDGHLEKRSKTSVQDNRWWYITSNF
jgi:prepilin-type processing-associated H-X9-DG protein